MKKTIKKIIPSFLLEYYYLSKNKGKYKGVSTEKTFTDIYETNLWSNGESMSGPGSTLKQTEIVRAELPRIFAQFGIKSMLDIPCGDFNWMKDVDLSNVDYIGSDIVKEMILKNESTYSTDKIHFRQLNLLKDDLPQVDLIFCRDCFIHFSYNDISIAVENIKKSKSKYLLTTTYFKRKKNIDIVTGDFRPINLEKEPFSFPAPLYKINEECTEVADLYADKCLYLWQIDTL